MNGPFSGTTYNQNGFHSLLFVTKLYYIEVRKKERKKERKKIYHLGVYKTDKRDKILPYFPLHGLGKNLPLI